MKKGICIAIDGHSSCGKSTMAKYLAGQIGYTYIDTGAMYRAVTLNALQDGAIDKEGNVDEVKLQGILDSIDIHFDSGDTILNGVNVEGSIRGMEVATFVSKLAQMPIVREKMVELQRIMGKDGGVVMDGRDIGTVVFPNAELKIFVTADANVRADRRYAELKAKNIDASYDEILENIKYRDYLDETRTISPLVKAKDALVLDNSQMTIEDQNNWLIETFNKVCKNQ